MFIENPASPYSALRGDLKHYCNDIRKFNRYNDCDTYDSLTLDENVRQVQTPDVQDFQEDGEA